MNNERILLERVEDRKIIRYYYYETLSLDFEEKKKIKLRFLDTGKYRLVCGCKNKIEMKISKDFKRIYPAKQNSKHSLSCSRGLSEKSIHNKGWKVDEITGETSVRLNFSLDPYKQNKLKEKKTDNKDIDKKVYKYSNTSDGKISSSALVKNLNLQTWRRKAFKGQVFCDKFDFWRTLYYGESNSINLNTEAIVNGKKTKNLKSMIFEPYKASEIKNNESRFAYMYLSDLKDLNNGNYEITCVYTNAKNKLLNYKFIVNKEKFNDELYKSRLNIDTLLNQDIVVSGFVFRNRFKRIEFFDISLIRCNKYGIYCESSYEADFYNMLSDNNKIFFKPNKKLTEYGAFKGYGNYIPDAILLEPNINKDIFIEIFGFNSSEYLRERENKLKLMKTNLKDTHDLIYWDAFRKAPIPTIEEIEEKISVHKYE